jgi:diguanylate cyclase (GGDEF)-like protein
MTTGEPRRGRDFLTGLPSGGAFEKSLRQCTRSTLKSQSRLAVILFGMDRFRRLNELLGYEAGDRALVEVSRRLASLSGSDRVVARLGGDEFAVIDPVSPDTESALAFAARLLGTLDRPIDVAGKEIFLSASIGLALCPQDSIDATDLLRLAGRAMEKAKSRGGSVIEIVAGARETNPEDRFRLENALRRAMERGEFNIRFQPQVDREGSLVGMEALLAWVHPELGQVDTQTFIELAEEIGLIIPIGSWVLENVCAQIADWRKRGLAPPRVAVNVSPIQFSDPSFVARVSEVIHAAGIPGDALELEVTENAVLQDLEESAARMASLRDLGVSIAIDDFGVGYSPLSYLHRLPIDSVKVDRTFVGQITKPSGSLPVLHTISVMAHNRGLKVVAEGVETAAELELVQAARFDRMQGYLFALPLPAAEIEQLVLDPAPLARAFSSHSTHDVVR